MRSAILFCSSRSTVALRRAVRLREYAAAPKPCGIRATKNTSSAASSRARAVP
jgi:hypothetical protein